nr:AlpA family phage regulatory protein [Sphingomonas hylomeconis]
MTLPHRLYFSALFRYSAYKRLVECPLPCPQQIFAFRPRLETPDVCRRVGFGKKMIYRLMQNRRFPLHFKVGAASSRWS